ncbi:MAG: AAA domain-containing protein, partial [Rhodothermales bacterium]
SLLGVSGGPLMEELLTLSFQLGFDDPETRPELDEVFLRLQDIHPEWPWREAPEVDSLSSDPALSEVDSTGIYNRAIFYMTERSQYTKGLENELHQMRKTSDEALEGTALGHILYSGSRQANAPARDDQPILEVIPLNTEQRAATESAMERPLTAITGPPGTGKSQVVTEIVANAVWRGQRVLVASKNNKAVDVVENRVNELSDQPSLFRLGANQLQQRLADYLSAVLSSSVGEEERRRSHELEEEYNRRREELSRLEDTRREVLETRNEVDRRSREAEAARERLGATLFARAEDADPEAVESSLDSAIDSLVRLQRHRQPLFTRLLWGVFRSKRQEQAYCALDAFREFAQVLTDEELPAAIDEALAETVEKKLRSLRARLDDVRLARDYAVKLAELRRLPSLEELSRREMKDRSEMYGLAARLWSAWLTLLPERLDSPARQALSKYASTLKLIAGQLKDGGSADSRLWAQYYSLSQEVSPHLAAWAVTSLSARGRVPFEPAAFDLVVIDEASQCDIASALPLLYRAKRAVIIGDPNQLRHISTVSEKLDTQLLAKHDLLELTDWAYSTNSLYDLASGRAGDGGVIALRDHHRSHARIIDFSNRHFYGGKLRVATRYDRLRMLDADGSPVKWINVTGETIRPEQGGAVNRMEAKRVVEELARIYRDYGFSGSVGVVTPFRAHANLIRRMVEDQGLPSHTAIESELIIDTVHRFQGDERDIIVFSPVVSSGASDTSLRFLELNKHLFNVAITRARAGLLVVGDRSYIGRLPREHVLRRFAEYVDEVEDEQIGSEDQHLSPPEDLEYPAVARPELVSDYERIFYAALREAGMRPIPQYSVDQYLLDFALFDGERKLAVEVDGERYHRDWDGELLVRDRLRNMRLMELGWDVMRFWVYELRDHLPACVERVRKWLEAEE